MCLPRESAVSLRCQSHLTCTLTFGFRASFKQWTGCAISSGVLFQSVFETQLFDISTFFDSSWNPRQFCVCVCVEMLFLKNFTRCCGQWNMVLKVMMVGEWGIKRNNRGWLCENLANKKNLKSLLQSVSLTLKKKACKILNYKNH